MKTRTASIQIYNVLFHICLAFMLIDWAFPIPFIAGMFGLYDVAFVLLGLIFVFLFLKDPKGFFKKLQQTIKPSFGVIVLLMLYLLMGGITMFYAKDPGYAATRYVVAGQMLIFAAYLMVFLYADGEHGEKGKLLSIYANLGITSWVIAVLAMIGYFSGIYTKYDFRISPIDDYNQYSTILLIGFVCACFYLFNSKIGRGLKYVVLGIFSVVLIPAIYISGSRRSALLLVAVGILYALIAIVIEGVQYRKSRHMRSLVTGVISVALCVFVAYAGIDGITRATEFVGTLRTEVQVQPDDSASNPGDNTSVPDDTVGAPEQGADTLPGVQENTVTETYESMVSGGAMSKREIIWTAAWKKIANSDLAQIIYGYGASYSSDLYDDIDDPYVMEVHYAYRYQVKERNAHWMSTHNLFLQDMLEGGLLLLGLQLAIIAASGIMILKLLRKEPLVAISLGTVYAIVFATLVLSSSRGMIANKFFWIAIMMLVFQNQRICQERE